MAQDERYNGWTNRETWAVALHINNDQGWQESVHEALRGESDGWQDDDEPTTEPTISAARAGEIIRERVESEIDLDDVLGNIGDDVDAMEATWRAQRSFLDDVGSLWRVNWDEIGAAFLADVAEQDAYENGEG